MEINHKTLTKMRIGLIEEDVWVTRDQMGGHVEE